VLAENLPTLTLPAATTPGDIAARLGVLDDLTIYELGGVVLANVTDRVQRARTITRLYRLLALPFSLFGSVVIAFAFTAGYRRVNRVGSEMLYGILVGFVVYIVSELAGRAGYAGTLHPLAAVLAPAALALIGGATVLLHREDGLR
jgi:lipopolysaccharide export system permease protein